MKRVWTLVCWVLIGAVVATSAIGLLTGRWIVVTYTKDFRPVRVQAPLRDAIRDNAPLAQIRQLLDAQPGLVHRDFFGFLPVHDAVASDRVDVARLLLERGAAADLNRPIQIDAHRRGEVPITMAVHGGNVEMVELLIRAGADPQTRSSWGESLVDIARRRKDGAMVALLRRYLQPSSSAKSLVP